MHAFGGMVGMVRVRVCVDVICSPLGRDTLTGTNTFDLFGV